MIAGLDDLISRREAARVAGVHYNTIRLWEQTGRITPHKQDSGDVLVSRAELESVMVARKEDVGDDDPRVAALETEVRLLVAERDRLLEQVEEASKRYERLVDKLAHTIDGP